MSGMYVLQDDGTLVAMRAEPYNSEDVLQRLLAQYPSLLAGEQMDSRVPRRWLLLSQEVGVPSVEGGADRWAVDHLYLDQDAVPMLVEVKRSTDTRIRREVVGQMLDYAANAVVYWPVEQLRADFAARCDADGTDPSLVVADFLQGGDPEVFWQQVKTNLQAGRVRMVFVADVIPPELQRIVEFLSTQMDPAMVLAVEIKQYRGQGLTTLVPRVLGQTAEAQFKKNASRTWGTEWTETTFFAALMERRGRAEVEAARSILSWAQSKHLGIWWGKGKLDGSFYPTLGHDGGIHYTVAVWTYGTVEVQFERMKTHAPFDDQALRAELRDRLNTIPGVAIPLDATGRRPTFRLDVLFTEVAMHMFLETLDWIVEQITVP